MIINLLALKNRQKSYFNTIFHCFEQDFISIFVASQRYAI